MNRLLKFSLALLATFTVLSASTSASAFSPQILSVVQKPTTVAKAKSLIRSLYYGYQQATYKGWASHKKFILANNYPGMYANPKGCLDKLSRYNDIMPDLSSVAKDANWKLPKGVYLNKLSGKKPAGETFVFQANDEGTQVFNHVTILKGKAYFFLWVCKKANPVVADTELTANRAYFSSLANLVDDENAIIAEYGSVTGANYTSDQAVYTMVVNIIPETQQYIARINTLPTGTTKLYQLNQTYLNAWSSYLNAFSTLKTALDRQDATLITKSNEYLMEARNFVTDFVSSASTFRR
jgi:hypothetical protein